MSKTKKNIAASIRQRLLNKAKAEKRPFNDVCAVLTEFLVVFLPSSTIPKHNWKAGGPWAAVQRAK